MGKRYDAVKEVMADGDWHTLREVAQLAGYSETSVSAQLRDYRKPHFGHHIVRKRVRVGRLDNANSEVEYEYKVMFIEWGVEVVVNARASVDAWLE